jgi:polygalacturonase
METFVKAVLIASGVFATLATATRQAPAPRVGDATVKRDDPTCTFSGPDGYSSVKASKTACSTIVLSDLTVPGGVTLDLEDLSNGTTVRHTAL